MPPLSKLASPLFMGIATWDAGEAGVWGGRNRPARDRRVEMILDVTDGETARLLIFLLLFICGPLALWVLWRR